MKASTVRILSIFLSGVLFIATLIVYTNFIRPAASDVGEKRSVLFSKTTTFQNQREAVGRVQELVSRLRGAAELERTVSLLLPAKPGVTEVLGQVRAITESSGVALRSFSISAQPLQSSPSPLVRRLGVLQLGLSIEGPYESIKRFLQALETNVRVFNAQTFRIGPAGGKESGAGNFVANVTVEVYYQE